MTIAAMTPVMIAIKTVVLSDGRVAAHFIRSPGYAILPSQVGAESSASSVDHEADAVKHLYRLYPGVPSNLPIERYGLDGMTRID